MTIKQHKSTNNNFEFQSLSNFCGLNVYYYDQVPPLLGNSGWSMNDTLAGFSIEIYIYKKAALTFNIKHYCMLSICQLQVHYKSRFCMGLFTWHSMRVPDWTKSKTRKKMYKKKRKRILQVLKQKLKNILWERHSYFSPSS